MVKFVGRVEGTFSCPGRMQASGELGLMWGSGLRDGRIQMCQGARLCLLLLCALQSHVAAVISCHEGLAEGQKLHNLPLKQWGTMPLLPFLSLSSLKFLSPQLLISSCWSIPSTSHSVLSFHVVHSSLCPFISFTLLLNGAYLFLHLLLLWSTVSLKVILSHDYTVKTMYGSLTKKIINLRQ